MCATGVWLIGVACDKVKSHVVRLLVAVVQSQPSFDVHQRRVLREKMHSQGSVGRVG